MYVCQDKVETNHNLPDIGREPRTAECQREEHAMAIMTGLANMAQPVLVTILMLRQVLRVQDRVGR